MAEWTLSGIITHGIETCYIRCVTFQRMSWLTQILSHTKTHTRVPDQSATHPVFPETNLLTSKVPDRQLRI